MFCILLELNMDQNLSLTIHLIMSNSKSCVQAQTHRAKLRVTFGNSFWTNLPDFLKSNLNALITQKALAINISLFIIILLLLAIYCIYILVLTWQCGRMDATNPPKKTALFLSSGKGKRCNPVHAFFCLAPVSRSRISRVWGPPPRAASWSVADV